MPTDPARQECVPKLRSSVQPSKPEKVVDFPSATPLDMPIEEHFQLDKFIGKGSFGVIRGGVMKGSRVVVKCVLYSHLQEGGSDNMFDVQVKMAKELVHKNLVSMWGAFHGLDEVTGVESKVATLCLAMEDITGLDLFEKVASTRLNQNLATRFVWQMLSGIAHCHQLDVCHRDIRPENYLLSSQAEDAELKLCDFSLARMNQDGEYMCTMLGCLPYVAPEVIRGKYDKKCDVWSVGVVSFLCCAWRLPIYDENDGVLAMKTERLEAILQIL